MKLYVEYTPFNGKTLDSYTKDKDLTFQHYGPYYGSLEGEEWYLQKFLPELETNFGIQVLTEDEFVGKLYLMFNEYDGPESEEEDGYVAPENRPDISDYLTGLGFTNFDYLDCAKAYKKVELKRALRKQMEDTSDMAADITKLMLLKTVYYEGASASEKSEIDGLLNRLQSVYSKASCMSGVENMVTELESVLTGYYTKVAGLESATDKDVIEKTTLE